jgi:hypothetical protein
MATYSKDGKSQHYRAQSRSSSGSSSVSYDYSGLKDHLARQDVVADAAAKKKAALMQGDYTSAMGAADRIRQLVGMLRKSAPDTTERDPYRLKDPLAKVDRMSSQGSRSTYDTASLPGY